MRPPLGIVISSRFTDRLSKVPLEPGVYIMRSVAAPNANSTVASMAAA